jgi:hypothetical protein
MIPDGISQERTTQKSCYQAVGWGWGRATGVLALAGLKRKTTPAS